jgi:hypothetical protein
MMIGVTSPLSGRLQTAWRKSLPKRTNISREVASADSDGGDPGDGLKHNNKCYLDIRTNFTLRLIA